MAEYRFEPINIINTAAVMEQVGAFYIDMTRRLRAIETWMLPPDIIGEAETCLEGTATLTFEQGTDLGTKGSMLRERIMHFLENEMIDSTGKFTDAVSAGEGLKAMSDLVRETEGFRRTSKAFRRAQAAYAAAALLALQRSKGGRISITSIESAAKHLDKLAEARAVKKVRTLPRWAKRFRVIPIAGAAVDFYSGYTQSAGRNWWVKTQSAFGSTVANNLPFIGTGQDIWDTGAWVTGNEGYQTTPYMQFSIDAGNVGQDHDKKGLHTLYVQMQRGDHGELARMEFGDLSEKEFIAKFWGGQGGER